MVMTMEFSEMKRRAQKMRTERELTRDRLRQIKKDIERIERSVESGEKARLIVQNIARATQQNLEYHISNIVTTALNAIWDKPLQFTVQMVMRRNKTECDLLIKEGDSEPVSPLESRGGGVLDVVSFSLRIAYWSLRKNRPTFILDEPFRFVSPDLQRQVSDMLKMLSERLGLQIVMVSHAEDVNHNADKTFVVSAGRGGKSICRERVDGGPLPGV